MVGAKSDTVSLTLRGKNGVLRSLESVVATTYVVNAMIRLDVAWIPGIAGLRKFSVRSLIASYINITEIRLEKISSVNFVKYSTKLDVEKNADKYRKRLDQIPTQA